MRPFDWRPDKQRVRLATQRSGAAPTCLEGRNQHEETRGRHGERQRESESERGVELRRSTKVDDAVRLAKAYPKHTKSIHNEWL